MTAIDTFKSDESFARRLDSNDPLASLRERFDMIPGKIYMLGNSLGLMPKTAAQAVGGVIKEWRNLGIGGWLDGDPPWFYLAERTGEVAAALVGASPDEVICTGTTTFNIHSLVSTFYRPALGRKKIIASTMDFPTDIYALKSQISLHGLDWREHLILVEPDESGIVSEDNIIDAMANDVSIVHLPSVFYRSGQLLDIERLTTAAHERDIMIGFDCSHSVGVIPHRFDDWCIDFAMWCSYKYLCGGPGAPAFIFLGRKHFDCDPGLAGWFGYVKERQFDMNLDFEHAKSAGGWQVSSPGILGAAAVAGSLEVINEAGIEQIREKSLRMTSYLIYLTDELLSQAPYDFRVVTPREPRRRGGHVALTRHDGALGIKEALDLRGVVADFRPPNVIRFAPSPLYSTYHDVWSVVRHLREIIDTGEHDRLSSSRRKPIS
ncbi:MAG: kynureninase [Candidatus Latescibacterota bacterium]|nr:MAG: kynureninase [Candidatus Latescibacterota bacterium]